MLEQEKTVLLPNCACTFFKQTSSWLSKLKFAQSQNSSEEPCEKSAESRYTWRIVPGISTLFTRNYVSILEGKDKWKSHA